MSDQDYGAMTDEQQVAVALAIYKLSPEQLVKVLKAIVTTLHNSYGVEISVWRGDVVIWP